MNSGTTPPAGPRLSRWTRLPAPYQGDRDPNNGVETLLTEGDFNPATGTLWMSAKGRGLADCGLAAEWLWDGERFRLASLSAQQQCGGDAGDWPGLFRLLGSKT